MDRDEALKLLRRGQEGHIEWNRYRLRNEPVPDLSKADLADADLSGSECDILIDGAPNLSRCNLSEANLSRADLGGVNLSEAILDAADLSGAEMEFTLLRGANLHGANLNCSRLTEVDLRESNLSGVDLSSATLTRAELRGANVSDAVCESTLFANTDLSGVRGLESIKHMGPSTIGIDTLFLSEGKIPEVFLRQCGLTPWEVLAVKLYTPELTPAGLKNLQDQIFDAWTKGRSMINGCFISYSWKDSNFVDKLHDRLEREGINVWLDRHEMVAGTIQDQIWRAIQVHHVVIIVLSKDSVESDWVENELDMARQKEKAEKRAVLCPIALDDTWKSKTAAKDTPGDPSRPLWRPLQQKLVVDFHGWKTKAFDDAFERLVRGLKVNYGPGDPPGMTR